MTPTPFPGPLSVLSGHLYSALLFLFSNSEPLHRGMKIKQNTMVGVHRWGICSTNAFWTFEQGRLANTTEFRIKPHIL